jgi:hypothetical protein
MQLEAMTPEQPPHLAMLVRQFQLAVARQHQRDGEIISALVRVLMNTGGTGRADAQRFTEIVRRIARDELDLSRELQGAA